MVTREEVLAGLAIVAACLIVLGVVGLVDPDAFGSYSVMREASVPLALIAFGLATGIAVAFFKRQG